MSIESWKPLQLSQLSRYDGDKMCGLDGQVATDIGFVLVCVRRPKLGYQDDRPLDYIAFRGFHKGRVWFEQWDSGKRPVSFSKPTLARWAKQFAARVIEQAGV